MKKIIVGITGASGAPYAKRLLEILDGQVELHVVYSTTSPLVFHEEIGGSLKDFLDSLKSVSLHNHKNFLSPIASGSNKFDATVIVPCSMKTLGQVATGVGETLLTRVCDIALKERRQLIMVPREAPFSTVHLENMLRISQVGGIILPAAPGFYHKPKNVADIVDFIVNRILLLLDLPIEIVKPWKAEN